MAKNVTIIDYGLGNLRSVMRGIEAAGARAVITGDAGEIAAADGIVLPGVGAFHEGMDQLGAIRETVCAATKDVPLLGICLGMQMLMDSSEEHGTHQGLGLIPGRVRRFPHVPGVKVPHMGWNTIRLTKEESPLLLRSPARSVRVFRSLVLCRYDTGIHPYFNGLYSSLCLVHCPGRCIRRTVSPGKERGCRPAAAQKFYRPDLTVFGAPVD